MVNIAYYTQLLMTLVLLPLALYSEDRTTVTSVIVLVVIIVAGYRGYLPALNRLGDRTTAFNLAALFAVLAAFAVYNLQEAFVGNWNFPSYSPEIDATTLRQILGLFAMVQGFEASRYIGARFCRRSADFHNAVGPDHRDRGVRCPDSPRTAAVRRVSASR